MRLHVLGCSGGSAPGHLPTSFLIDGTLALDGGAVTTALDEAGQERIDHVVLSHAHLDHVACLPFLLDNRFARQQRPISVYGAEATLEHLREGIFNNRIWPDFTALRTQKGMALHFVPVFAGETFGAGHLRLTPARMDHPVPCFGYRVESRETAIFVAGDTGSAAGVKEAVAGVTDLAALVLEVSWPNRMHDLARQVGHLVPKDLAAAWPLHPAARVLVTHIKPFQRDEVLAELEALRLPGLEILEDGMLLEF